jgi:hypothetical protein
MAIPLSDESQVKSTTSRREQAPAPTTHVIGEPEWVIGRDTGFRVTCGCGWASPLVDTASMVRSIAFDHVTRSQPAVEPARRSRWRRRG